MNKRIRLTEQEENLLLQKRNSTEKNSNRRYWLNPKEVKWLNEVRGENKEGKEERSNLKIEENKDGKSVSGNAKSLEDLLEKAKVDLSIWEVYEHEIKDEAWDVTMKMKNNGTQKAEKHTNYLYYIRAKLRLKKTIIYKDKFKEELIEDIKKLKDLKFIPKIYLNKNEECFALEINRFDLHYGKLIWGEETGGDNYDTKIALQMYKEAGAYLLNEARKFFNIDKVVIPTGNDLFNSDNVYPFPSTTKGTPQQEDLRWQKTYRNVRVFVSEDILMFNQIAPVDVPIVCGNHDQVKSFYLGDGLECVFMHNNTVKVDNSANQHKYWVYGNTLLGYIHNTDSMARLATTMQHDRPDLWFNSKYREWHLGDIHHSRKLEILTEEDFQGITVRYLRTLMPTEGWENSKLYRSNKGAEAFIWSKDKGLKCYIPFNV